MTTNFIKDSLAEAQEVLQNYCSDSKIIQAIENAINMMSDALIRGNKIIACGNGGSLCDATHFAEEMTARFRNNRCALPAIAINDPGHITCVGNDFGYDYIFSRYIEAVGQPGDVLLAFSTSGNSANIISAAKTAKENELSVIGMSRASTTDNELSRYADIFIGVPHQGYADRIQEMHILTVHIMVQGIEYKMGLNT
ncbi:SIS domain-containing protein [Limibacterium fermenti]|uniref:SIS domain-containing protein n=1 Tax=Limibacterium fermenti TaxID=3229863 RepID=UPI000E9591E0|nr:phosphoheptose isomerase [Porphyromonadaceae bacterium]